jgi:DNA-binding IclR family transcriptional regulator
MATLPRMVKSVEHALDILDQFTADAPFLTLADLSRRLDLSKSTIYQLLATLESRGIVERGANDGKYSLGLRLFQLGSLRVGLSGLSDVATPYLTQLRDTSGETVHLGIIYRDSILYVAKVESLHTIRMGSRIGGTSPLYCTGIGKMLLAYQPQAFVDEVLSRPLGRFTANTLTEAALLTEELAHIRASGCAFDHEEHEPHVRCVAAPIRDHTGDVVAAISCSGPDIRLTNERMDRLAPEVVRTALGLSQRIGYCGIEAAVDPPPVPALDAS